MLARRTGPIRTQRGRFIGLVSGVAGLLLCAPFVAVAKDAPRETEPPPPALEAPPDELSPEDLERYWSEATSVEMEILTGEDEREIDQLSRDLDRAAHYFQRVAESPSGNPSGYWRAARATWLAGEILPLDAKDAKIERFARAEALTDIGLEQNPECAECMLWKFISIGRTSTTAGMMDAARAVPEMADLLDRALEIGPTHVDSPDNSTLGNLHYSSAIFYRLVPDWFFIKWVLGVRGDKERALAHSQKALALHPNRLDFRIEVATQMLCIGSAKKDKVRLVEGRRLMEDAIATVPETEDERREIQFAKVLLEEPKKACGYTGDSIVEIDEKEARKSKKKK